MNRPPISAETVAIINERLAQHLRAKPLAKDLGFGNQAPEACRAPGAGDPSPRKPALFASGAPLPPRGERSLPSQDIIAGLRALVEGRLACEQPMRFMRVAFSASMGGLIETRGALYYLTAAGKEAIR